MPGWIQVLIATAAFLSALTIIWKTAIKPGAKLISQAETTIPLLQKLTAEWSNTPNLPGVLKEIVDQFHTNGGSSLKDNIVSLTASADENKKAAAANAEAVTHLAVQMEVNRLLAEQDRRYLEKVVELVQTMDARLRVGVQGVSDIQTEQHGVADDLASSIERANASDETQFGASADAALRSTKEEKRITQERHLDDQSS